MTKIKSEEQTELNPKIEKKVFMLPDVDLQLLDKQIDINTILDTDKEDDDSFFKSVVTQLFNNNDVETKSETRNAKEVFALTKMSYIGDYCGVPNMSKFVERFERKRISMGRKGRVELVTSLIERQQEIERRQQEKMKKLGLGMIQ